ncbi:MAG TPA: PqiC family protein [Nevskia sp.]|nr:PqiC family protein [Nevskia sp.]
MSAMTIHRSIPVLACAALAACAEAPTQFYTLLPPPAAAPPAAAAAPYQIDVQGVEVPPQVATQQMVVRTGAGELVPVDTRRWIAPLGDEIRDALSASLARRLGAHDVHGLSHAVLPEGQGLPTWRIRLRVQRFESALGASARIDALWTLRRGDDAAAALTCASSVTESVGPGYEALAEGHQRAVAKLAARIAAALGGAQNGAARCPAD